MGKIFLFLSNCYRISHRPVIVHSSWISMNRRIANSSIDYVYQNQQRNKTNLEIWDHSKTTKQATASNDDSQNKFQFLSTSTRLLLRTWEIAFQCSLAAFLVWELGKMKRKSSFVETTADYVHIKLKNVSCHSLFSLSLTQVERRPSISSSSE